jgi:hypothetical protein
MKSERRHELQHNDLAEWLMMAAEVVKPYQNIALMGVGLVLVVMVGYTLLSRASSAQTAQAWNDVDAAIEGGDITRLEAVTEAYAGTSAAHMASVVLADYQLGSGCNQLFKNKALGQENLSKAIQRYERVRQECPAASIRERATFGLARAREAKGELSEAETLYKEVAKNPNGAFTKTANERLADLARPATRKFYDEFAHFDPKPAFSETEKKPDFDANAIPQEGPISTTAPELKGKDEKKEKAADTKAAAPKAKEEKPKEAKGAEKK